MGDQKEGKRRKDPITTALMVVAILITIVAVQNLRAGRPEDLLSWFFAALYWACAVVAWLQYARCRRIDRKLSDHLDRMDGE